jgi:diguanylate cyclase (GGDEF)-like protein
MFAFIDFDNKIYKFLLYAVSLLLIAFIGYIDFISGEISLSLLYLAPVAVISWHLGRWEGASFALIASLAQFFANFTTLPHPPRGIEIWNFFIRLCFYLIVSYLIFHNRELFKNVRDAARKDFLTDINNARSFYEQAARELDRSRRNKTPLSIAYLDLDNFKSINDTRGHSEGDRLLKIAAKVLDSGTRAIDMVARLGGDEFVVLFPGGSYRQTQAAVKRLQGKLAQAIREENFPVTFSIGAATFRTAPDSVEIMVHKADALMCEVKKSGKNNSLHIALT